MRSPLIALALVLVTAIAMGQTFPSPLSSSLTTVLVSDSLIRPGNGTAYAINDVVNDSASSAKILRFVNVARSSGGSGYVTSVSVFADTANSANAWFRLYLFADSVVSAADNAAFPQLAAWNNTLIDYVDLVLTSGGSGSTAAFGTANGWNKVFRTGTNSRNLYGILVAQAAYTPKWWGKFTVTLSVHRY
jgi:hypothetical protein